MLFIDLRQALDSENRKTLRITLKVLEIPKKILRLALLRLNDSRGIVVLGKNKSRDFMVWNWNKAG